MKRRDDSTSTAGVRLLPRRQYGFCQPAKTITCQPLDVLYGRWVPFHSASPESPHALILMAAWDKPPVIIGRFVAQRICCRRSVICSYSVSQSAVIQVNGSCCRVVTHSWCSLFNDVEHSIFVNQQQQRLNGCITSSLLLPVYLSCRSCRSQHAEWKVYYVCRWHGAELYVSMTLL